MYLIYKGIPRIVLIEIRIVWHWISTIQAILIHHMLHIVEDWRQAVSSPVAQWKDKL